MGKGSFRRIKITEKLFSILLVKRIFFRLAKMALGQVHAIYSLPE